MAENFYALGMAIRNISTRTTYIQYPNCIIGCGNQKTLSMAKVDKSTCRRFHFGYASFYYILDEIEQWLCRLRR